MEGNSVILKIKEVAQKFHVSRGLRKQLILLADFMSQFNNFLHK